MNLIFGITTPGTQPIAGDGPDLAARLLTRLFRLHPCTVLDDWRQECDRLRQALADEGITESPAKQWPDGFLNVYANGHTSLHGTLGGAKALELSSGPAFCYTTRVRLIEVPEGEAL